MNLIRWWLGDPDKKIIGEREKREKAQVKSNMKEAGLIKEKERTARQQDIIDLAKDAGIQNPKQLIQELSNITFKDMDGQDTKLDPKTKYSDLLGMIEHNDDFYEQARKAFGGDVSENEEEL